MASINNSSKAFYSLSKKVTRNTAKSKHLTVFDKLLLTTLAILLVLLMLQILMLMFGLNKAEAKDISLKPESETLKGTVTIYEDRSEVSNRLLREQIIAAKLTAGQQGSKPLNGAELTQAKITNNTTWLAALPQQDGQILSNNYYHEFTIYSADTYLHEDVDEDGYYRTFSLAFDADVYSSDHHSAVDVYAEVYLSKAGGPWQHFYSSDIFTIVGDSTLDEYEVITTLFEGRESDYYDVLIDLYEVGYPNIVATYSAYDSDSLYGLPLESADYDQPHYDSYVVYEEHHHGASIDKLWLLALMVFIAIRMRDNQACKNNQLKIYSNRK